MQHSANFEPVKYAQLSLDAGPIDVRLSDHHLRIVDPLRDLTQHQQRGLNVGIGCFVIDPNTFYQQPTTGLKALRMNESIILGRSSHYNRFAFNSSVSRQHLEIIRFGDQIRLQDLGSSNGSFIGKQVLGRTVDLEDLSVVHDVLSQPNFLQAAAQGRSIGKERNPDTGNEDAFFTDPKHQAAGVFDGVGGNAGSGEAARIAANIVERQLQRFDSKLPVGLSTRLLKEALEEAHHAIKKSGQNSGIATTATIAKLFVSPEGAPYAAVASVGDSRVYLYRNRILQLIDLNQGFNLSDDPIEAQAIQTTLDEFTDISKLNDKEQKAFRHRNIITSSLGGRGLPTVTSSHVPLQSGDRLLLTTDGVHDNLTTQEIENCLRISLNDAEISSSVVNYAQQRSKDRQHARSKPDDITAVSLTVL